MLREVIVSTCIKCDSFIYGRALIHAIFLRPLVVPNLGLCRLAMADRSGPSMALILRASLRIRGGQHNDPGPGWPLP
jgi:hypothetical protein